MITLSAIVGLSTLLLIHSSRSLRNSEIAIPIFLQRLPKIQLEKPPVYSNNYHFHGLESIHMCVGSKD